MIFGIKADEAADRGYRVICIFKMLDSNVNPYGIKKTNGSFAKLTSEVGEIFAVSLAPKGAIL